MSKSKILGVLGGLGPMATAYFYELVTAHTLVEKDQDHIDMVISSKATTPDRTAFILGKSKEDPFSIMKSEALRLVTFGAEVLAIPCNTAHYFYDDLNNTVNIPVLNMVRETAEKGKSMGCTRLGILATDGTVDTQTYQIACKMSGINWAIPSKKNQQAIMEVIYEDIKTGKEPDMNKFNAAADELFSVGCQQIILGCTELSLIKKKKLIGKGFIDSMEVLAELAIVNCGKETTGFCWE